mmetsp:Transcript_33749/g.39695  ORF Transcript_33749/g.39695 Transcript_33749/m.39695 type:complete len:96 (-) Transcript_33749:56-343(-)
MTTPDFEGFKTRVQINEPQQGPKPVSQAGVKFDSKGREKKVEVKDDKKKEEEQSFFSKYWLYILGAMFILPRLLGPAEEGAAGSEGAAPTQGARR